MADSKTILQEVWRASNERPSGITIPCGSEKAAVSLRFAMYNAVKVYRSGKALPDERLRAALEECSIGFTDDRQGLIVKKKSEIGVMPNVLAALGMTDILSADDLAAQEASARIMAQVERMGGVSEQSPKPKITSDNPYGVRYGRSE